MSIIHQSKNSQEDCPCCNSPDGQRFIAPYELSSSTINTSRSSYVFFHDPKYCGHCGHIWNAKPPSDSELARYYEDQFLHHAEDYDIHKRINLIKAFLPNGNSKDLTLLDFGSNRRASFHEQLADTGLNVETFDIVGDHGAFPQGSLNFLTCYFVLEHVLAPDEHFKHFQTMLAEDGVLIVEVPGCELYEVDHSALLHEHQQHFQMSSLEHLARRHGFVRIHSSWEDCSRGFGFAMVFKKGTNALSEPLTPKDTRQSFAAGRLRQEESKRYGERFIETHSLTDFENIVIWGVNPYYVQLRESLDIAIAGQGPSVFALDMDGKKKGFVIGKDRFVSPEAFLANPETFLTASQDLKTNTLVVITASAHAKQILPRLADFDRIKLYDPTEG